MRDVVLGRPSLALIPLGILLFCHGMGFLVGFVHRGGSTWPRVFGMLMDAPARLGGLILIAWATGLLVVGGVEWLRPECSTNGFRFDLRQSVGRSQRP